MLANIEKATGSPIGSLSAQKDKLADYSQMSVQELDTVLATKLLQDFRSWVQLMFQGELCTITKCGTCEYQSVREETFMNLSIDI